MTAKIARSLADASRSPFPDGLILESPPDWRAKFLSRQAVQPYVPRSVASGRAA